MNLKKFYLLITTLSGLIILVAAPITLAYFALKHLNEKVIRQLLGTYISESSIEENMLSDSEREYLRSLIRFEATHIVAIIGFMIITTIIPFLSLLTIPGLLLVELIHLILIINATIKILKNEAYTLPFGLSLIKLNV